MVWFLECSVVRLDLRLDFLHAVELLFVFFKWLRKEAVISDLCRAEEVVLERIRHALAMLDELVLAALKVVHVLILLLHLLDKEGLILRLLPGLALKFLLLEPALFHIDFFSRSH